MLDTREKDNKRRSEKIYKMNDAELVQELKKKGLPCYGKRSEKVDRLKKYHGN